MTDESATSPLVLLPHEITVFDRGVGIQTLPFVGKWNTVDNVCTTGITVFAPGTGIPLHLHNVEETVLIVSGEATVTLGENEYHLIAGAVTWAPAGVAHRFQNAGDGELRIYWAYGGRHVTRTICATGVTVEHLSDGDRAP